MTSRGLFQLEPFYDSVILQALSRDCIEEVLNTWCPAVSKHQDRLTCLQCPCVIGSQAAWRWELSEIGVLAMAALPRGALNSL